VGIGAGCAFPLHSAEVRASVAVPKDWTARFDVPYLQSFAIDDQANHLYVQWSDPESPDLCFITRYRIDPDGDVTYLDQMQPSPAIGHQGLTMVKDRKPLLLAPSGESWNCLVSFEYVPGQQPQGMKRYAVLDRRFRRNATVTTGVSYDQKHVLVVSRIGNATSLRNVVRIFDLQQMLLNMQSTRTQDPLYEWDIPFYPQSPIQGISANNDTVHMVMGGSKAYTKRLFFSYNLAGVSTEAPKNLSIPVYLQNTFSPASAIEPEGLGFAKLFGEREARLYIGYNLGRKKHRSRAIIAL
jgi:hypothetical protein